MPYPKNRSQLPTNLSANLSGNSSGNSSGNGSGNNRNLNPALLAPSAESNPHKPRTTSGSGMPKPPSSAATSAAVSTAAAVGVPPTKQQPIHRSGTAMHPLRFTPLPVLALATDPAAWAALHAQDWLGTIAEDRARLAQMDFRLSALARVSAKPVLFGANPAPPLIVATRTTSATDQQRQLKTIDELGQRLATVEQRIEHHAAQQS